MTLAAVRGATGMETARRIIRRLMRMTQRLAMKFSLTSLGEKRERTKLSFKEHVVAAPVIGKH